MDVSGRACKLSQEALGCGACHRTRLAVLAHCYSESASRTPRASIRKSVRAVADISHNERAAFEAYKEPL
eukprot:1978128-Amphidinium_carterae.1